MKKFYRVFLLLYLLFKILVILLKNYCNNFVLKNSTTECDIARQFAMTVKSLSYLTHFTFTLPYRAQIPATPK